MNKKITLQETL